uniref:DUF659 domain-containing protein n=1 Tax=Hyaloperonospora arabidopsidis (strain Emoy2) TaxID=559515 RepID=M4BZQ6_HYAAE
MTLKNDTLAYDINARIVNTIIGDLFFRDEEVLANADSDNDSDDDVANAIAKKASKQANEKTNALNLFVKNRNDPDWYQVIIKNVMRFELAVDHVSIGMSFRQTEDVIQHARDHTKTAKLTSMNDMIVGQYVRFLVGSSLQKVSDMMGDVSVWAFSLEFDASTHREQSSFDVRVQICYKGLLCNIHLVSLPMLDHQKAEIIYNLFVKFNDALYPHWCVKLLNSSSDGKNTMTGRHSGVVTRNARCAEFNVLHVWCATHQIDIIVKSAAESINGGACN